MVTGADVFLLLLIQRLGVRKLEAFILGLVAAIGLCFLVEVFLCRPSISGIAAGFVPHMLTGQELYVAIGIIGATVMPHNLYLHSALVQSRDVTRSREAVAEACRFNLVDAFVAMNGAFLINAAILIVAAATFWTRNIEVHEIQDAHALLEGFLGSQIAPYAFALALLCSGQSSTVTGTLAGQITMEGFLRFRMRPWLRRVTTRAMAIVPAVSVILAMGEGGVYQLLILSQVILSLQLSFAVVPLVRMTCSKRKMGPFASRWWVQALAWLATVALVVLNLELVYEELGAVGCWLWVLGDGWSPPSARRLHWGSSECCCGWRFVGRRADRSSPAYRPTKSFVRRRVRSGGFARLASLWTLSPPMGRCWPRAVALANTHSAGLVLIHVVNGVGGTWYGAQTGDSESRDDAVYLETVAEGLKKELCGRSIPTIETVLGYGDASSEIVRIARESGVDTLVLGGHGHRGLADLIHGQTITTVRHGLDIPVVAVRGK